MKYYIKRFWICSDRHLEVIDCHAHITPDNLAAKNRKIIEDSSGISPAYDGSVRELFLSMRKSGASKALVNNTVLKSELMSKANDYTARVVAENVGNIFGLAWIVPGSASSPEEVKRCKDLGFVGVKIHNSHFKLLPTERSNEDIYENMIECDIPVLFHCGANPFKDGVKQVEYSMPKSYEEVVKSFPEMKMILAHAAGYQDDRRGAINVVNSSKNVYCDLAIDPQRKLNMRQFFKEIDPSKILFGSDYPIYESVAILNRAKTELDESQMKLICSDNPRKVFGLPSEN
jgi:uncharacterized protein